VSPALDTRDPKRIDLLLAHFVETRPRKPVLDRLCEKIGIELAHALVFVLADGQRRSARRG
jgi:hypothetical protein